MTIVNASINRVTKSIPSLDEALGGALSESSFDVTAGPLGCCGIALAHQMTSTLTALERSHLFEGLLRGSPTRSQSVGQHVSERDGG